VGATELQIGSPPDGPTVRFEPSAGIAEGDIIQGYLLNISAGGCSVRVPLPMTLMLDAGVSFDVILPLHGGELLCAGEPVGLDVGKGTHSLRLRFRALHQDTRRSLLTLIGELVTRYFQLRNTGGNRAWVVRQRE